MEVEGGQVPQLNRLLEEMVRLPIDPVVSEACRLRLVQMKLDLATGPPGVATASAGAVGPHIASYPDLAFSARAAWAVSRQGRIVCERDSI